MDYIREVYKRRVQAEIESYKDSEDNDERYTIQSQDILILDKISIYLSIIYCLTNKLDIALVKINIPIPT